MILFSALYPLKASADTAPKGGRHGDSARHAEKLRTPGDENLRSVPTRAKRAQDLVRIVQPTGIKAIYTSQYLRTRSTAEPLAKSLGLEIQQVDASDTPGWCSAS